MARLKAAARNRLPDSDFAGPNRTYPIENASHGRNALSRSSGKPIAGRIRAAVHRRYPTMGASARKRKLAKLRAA